MPWLRKREFRRLLEDLEEARAQVWGFSSDVVDLRIDNENLVRKIEEYETFMAALLPLKRDIGI
jgi:hypothetical protein